MYIVLFHFGYKKKNDDKNCQQTFEQKQKEKTFCEISQRRPLTATLQAAAVFAVEFDFAVHLAPCMLQPHEDAVAPVQAFLRTKKCRQNNINKRHSSNKTHA